MRDFSDCSPVYLASFLPCVDGVAYAPHAIAASLAPYAGDVRDVVVDFVRRRWPVRHRVLHDAGRRRACADHLTDKLKDVGTTVTVITRA